MVDICPNCGSKDFRFTQDKLLRTAGGWFCPDCGFRESIGRHEKRIKQVSKAEEKKRILISFDDILRQINDNRILQWLNEWKMKLVHFLGGYQ